MRLDLQIYGRCPYKEVAAAAGIVLRLHGWEDHRLTRSGAHLTETSARPLAPPRGTEAATFRSRTFAAGLSPSGSRKSGVSNAT